MKVINSSLSKEQVDMVNKSLLNLPRKLNKSLKIRRIVVDLVGLFFIILTSYMQFDLTLSFFLFSGIFTLLMLFIIYFHTNQKRSNTLDLLISRKVWRKKYKLQISMKNNEIIITTRKKNNYNKISRLLDWNNMIVVIAGNGNKEGIGFLNLDNNDKNEFIIRAEDIYNLSLEHVDNDTKLSDFLIKVKNKD